MGEVYRARDTRLERDVAIKVLPPAVAADPDRVRRFQQEARAVAALNHPNICQIHDVGPGYLVLEYVDGLPPQGPLATDKTLKIAVQIASALDAAHRRGILHRDLKPGNMLVTADGTVKLLDFGLARLVGPESGASDLTRTSDGVVPGTPAYMSPEQAGGEALDARTDIFSLGAVLYEMATGRQAFTGSTPAVILMAVVNQQPPPAGRVNPDLPPELERIIAKALEKDRDLRYQSVADLGADLKRLHRDMESPHRAAVEPAKVRQVRGPKGIKSLAVLPLVNTSGDPDAAYLSEGIAESLINHFTEFPKLRVAQRHKSFRYAGDHVDLQRAARELDVQALLSGRILKHGDTLIVKVELVDIEKDAQVWGQQYSKHVSDIFVLQDEIADEVLRTLKVKLASEPKKRVVRYTSDTDAYHAYLRGRFYWARRTPDQMKKALECFEQAIELDPNYALAYAGVADCYAMPYGVLKPRDAYPRAKAAAERALSIDGSLGDAYASLGLCAFLYDWDWAAAERAFRRSIELAPNALGARLWYPALLVNIGRSEDAIREAQRAIEVDPLSVNAITLLGQVLYTARRYHEAARVLAQALDMDPGFPTALFYVGLIHLAKNEFSDAIKIFERTNALNPHPLWLATVGQVYGFAGRHDEARRILRELEEAARRTYVSPFSFATVYSGLGDMEAWRSMMQASLEERTGMLMWLMAPLHDGFRAHPHFQDFVRQAGLPPAVAVVHA
jgi:TolB-like protein/Tfp pilus assembly protein PilF